MDNTSSPNVDRSFKSFLYLPIDSEWHQNVTGSFLGHAPTFPLSATESSSELFQ